MRNLSEPPRGLHTCVRANTAVCSLNLCCQETGVHSHEATQADPDAWPCAGAKGCSEAACCTFCKLSSCWSCQGN